MPVDFHLSPSEAGIRAAAAGFAQTVLKPARAEYLKFEQHQYALLTSSTSCLFPLRGTDTA
jgi:hypothetical protein